MCGGGVEIKAEEQNTSISGCLTVLMASEVVNKQALNLIQPLCLKYYVKRLCSAVCLNVLLYCT